MSLKDTLKSLSKQGQITGTLALAGLSANTTSAETEQLSTSPSFLERVESITDYSAEMGKIISGEQSGTEFKNVLFDKEMWTFDFQRGVNNLVHDFFRASPYQTQQMIEKQDDGAVKSIHSRADLSEIFSIPSSKQQQQEIKKILNDVENTIPENMKHTRGTLFEKLQALRSGNGHFSQAEYKSGTAFTLDMYKGDGFQFNLGECANASNMARLLGARMPYISQDKVNKLFRYSVGVKHSGTDMAYESYEDHFKEHAIQAFLPPNISTIRGLLHTADSVFESKHRSTRLVGGYELDNGGKLAVSFGSVPIMEEFSSRGMSAPNEAHLMRDRFNVDQQVKNAICFDYITPQGDMHRLGYAESGKNGTIFSYDGTSGEVFYVGSTNALQDKLQVAAGGRANTALDGFEGFASVRYNPTSDTQAMFEVHGLGTNNPRCVASIQQDTNNFVFGAMAAASARERGVYGVVEHKDSGWYVGAGVERIEQSSGDKKTNIGAFLGHKWKIGR